jgi:hypothetical protein
MARRILLIAALLASVEASASEFRVEGTVTAFSVSLVAPGDGYGLARNYGTVAWLKLFPFENLGFRLMGGTGWYSALGFTPVTVAQANSPVVFATWEGMVGASYRVPVSERFFWLDFEASVGAMGATMALSQVGGELTSVALGAFPAGLVGATVYLRLERHIALTVGVQGMLYGTNAITLASCARDDARALAAAEARGAPLASVSVSQGCQKAELASLPAGSVSTAYRLIEHRTSLFAGAFGVLIGFTVF